MPAQNPAGRRLAAGAEIKFRLEVDGGINNETVAECARAGADTFVAGTSLFGARNLKSAITKMRKIASDNDPGLADLKFSARLFLRAFGGLDELPELGVFLQASSSPTLMPERKRNP